MRFMRFFQFYVIVFTLVLSSCENIHDIVSCLALKKPRQKGRGLHIV